MLGCSLDVGGLPALIPAAKKEYTGLTEQCVMHAVAESPIDSQLEQTLTRRFAVAQVARSQTVNSGRDFRLRASVA